MNVIIYYVYEKLNIISNIFGIFSNILANANLLIYNYY